MPSDRTGADGEVVFGWGNSRRVAFGEQAVEDAGGQVSVNFFGYFTSDFVFQGGAETCTFAVQAVTRGVAFFGGVVVTVGEDALSDAGADFGADFAAPGVDAQRFVVVGG